MFGVRRFGVAVGIVVVMVFSAAPGLVRATGVPPVVVADADSGTTEWTAVLPGTPIHFRSDGSSFGTTLTWYFGDNTPSVDGAVADHAFATDGIYDVTLVGQSLSGTMALDTVRVYVASPAYGTGGNVAVITATPSGPVEEDRVVIFDCRDSWPAGYSDALLTCAWDFGDHATASGLTVNHAYGFAGTYTVRLVVRDAAGNGHTATTAVTVTNQAPQPPAAPAPAFGITPAAPAEDETVFFDASASPDTATDDTALEFDWDFGDGTGGASEQAIHAYSAAGTYTVGLTVRDDHGATATASRSLTVSNPAPTANAGSAIAVPEAQTLLYAGTGTDTASDAGSLAYSWTGGTALKIGR